MIYSGRQLEDLRFAFDTMGALVYDSLQDVPPGYATIAVSKNAAEEIDDLNRAKAWLKQPDTKWYGFPGGAWHVITRYIDFEPSVVEFQIDEPGRIVQLLGFANIELATFDLGGNNPLGFPPMYAMLTNRNYNGRYDPDRAWISRDTGRLVEIAAAEQKGAVEAGWPERNNRAFWFVPVSGNMWSLVMRKLSRAYAEAEARNQEAIVKENEKIVSRSDDIRDYELGGRTDIQREGP